MELEQLRHFLKVAELENITRAAEAIGLSQSALSRSITRLEEELGQPLFERQTRRVTLTDAGQMLNDRALKIVQLADDTKAEIYDDGLTGRLRIGAIPTIAPYFLPECLRVFRKQCPQAQLIIQEETTENLLRSLTHGELDIGIAALPVTSKYLSVHRLFDEECWLVTAPDHPMAQQGEVHIRDLEGQPLVLLSEAHCLSSQIISFCQKKSITPVMVERASQLGDGAGVGCPRTRNQFDP